MITVNRTTDGDVTAVYMLVLITVWVLRDTTHKNTF